MRKIFFFFLLAMFLIAPPAAKAQTLETWSPPVNVSQSGVASNAAFAADSNGIGYVYWLDEFSGQMVSQIGVDGKTVSQPINLAFNMISPRFWIDSRDVIHAFWVDQRANLFYSAVPAENFVNAAAWRPPTTISGNVLAFDLTVTGDGALNLAYLNSVEADLRPAGIYFTSSQNNGLNWSSSRLIYESKYYRSMGSVDSNVRVAAGGDTDNPQIYIVWDNRAIKTVFFSNSGDLGQTWTPPVEIVSPNTLTSTSTPFNILVQATGQEVLLVYQFGQPGFSCSQSYIQSTDNGQTWGNPSRMLEGLAGCSIENRFLETGSGDAVLVSNFQNAVYLSAWDGLRWSKAQLQSEITSVTDPLTFTSLPLGKIQIQMGSNGNLYAAGVDTQKGDVWWQQRPLRSVIESWFNEDESWQTPRLITSANENFLSIVASTDSNGLIHAFWSKESGDILGRPASAIYYSRQDDQQIWSQPISLQLAPEQFADLPSVVSDMNGNLNLVWRAGRKGQIFFSQANAGLAILNSSWSQAIPLSDMRFPANSPQIQIDTDGRLYVVYVIPINESRGVYLTTSDDGGQNWSAPQRIIDGQSLGSEMIDAPHLAILDDGTLHLIWSAYQYRSGQNQAISLSYSRSGDGGATWSPAAPVSENPSLWSQIVSTPGILHRFWQEYDGKELLLWHEISSNAGDSWSRTRPFSFLGTKIGIPSVSWDAAGRLHLLQLVENDSGQYTLQHVIWDGNSWLNETGLGIQIESMLSIGSPASAISVQGALGVVFPISIATVDLITQAAGSQQQLLFSGQTLQDLPDLESPPPSPAGLTPEQDATATTQETAPPSEASATEETASGAINTNPGRSSGNPLTGAVAGVVLAVLAVGSMVVYRRVIKPGR